MSNAGRRPRARGGVPRRRPPGDPSRESSPRTRGCSAVSATTSTSTAVVPAHAGVFHSRHRQPVAERQSSPRTRGCSVEQLRLALDLAVVPAHAGVFLLLRRSPAAPARRPRARGGVPSPHTPPLSATASSPRTRGCSRAGLRVQVQAGRRPRARGGVPPGHGAPLGGHPSSPRTRGCSFGKGWVAPRNRVVPAHAGVFPPAGWPQSTRRCRPRARGGVPPRTTGCMTGCMSSPRTRGCSVRGVRLDGNGSVVPAHAGVFRSKNRS